MSTIGRKHIHVLALALVLLMAAGACSSAEPRDEPARPIAVGKVGVRTGDDYTYTASFEVTQWGPVRLNNADSRPGTTIVEIPVRATVSVLNTTEGSHSLPTDRFRRDFAILPVWDESSPMCSALGESGRLESLRKNEQSDASPEILGTACSTRTISVNMGAGLSPAYGEERKKDIDAVVTATVSTEDSPMMSSVVNTPMFIFANEFANDGQDGECHLTLGDLSYGLSFRQTQIYTTLWPTWSTWKR